MAIAKVHEWHRQIGLARHAAQRATSAGMPNPSTMMLKRFGAR
jgi:hypothetical protein